MTAVRSDVAGRATICLLDDRDRDEVERLLATDPYVSVAVAVRLAEADSLDYDRLGGHLVGIRAGDGSVGALCFAGGNAIPVGGDAAGWSALAGYLAHRPRPSSALVGRRDAVAGMYPALATTWGRPRAVRREQPLLVLDRAPSIAPDTDVRVAVAADLDRYVAAATAMFTDEIGMSPHVSPGTTAFVRRIGEIVARRRAFASFDFRGQVVFKAEIGAVSPYTAQVQGVWVRPDLRGRGIAAAGLASVFDHALRMAPTVSLYVNDFNTAARRVYARLGMREHAVLRTVLFD